MQTEGNFTSFSSVLEGSWSLGLLPGSFFSHFSLCFSTAESFFHYIVIFQSFSLFFTTAESFFHYIVIFLLHCYFSVIFPYFSVLLSHFFHYIVIFQSFFSHFSLFFSTAESFFHYIVIFQSFLLIFQYCWVIFPPVLRDAGKCVGTRPSWYCSIAEQPGSSL